MTVAALLIPWLLLASLWRRGGFDAASAVAYGLAPAMVAVYVALMFSPNGPWVTMQLGVLAVMAVIAVTALLTRPRLAPTGVPVAEWGTARRLLIMIASAMIAWRLAIIWHEAPRYPFYPWDSWLVWAMKAKIWWVEQRLVHFVEPRFWLTHGAQITDYPMPWWSYPSVVPAAVTWSAIAAGEFNPPQLIWWWPACYVALLIGVFAQTRRLCDGTTGIVTAALVSSVPLLITHAALPGNADLPLALAVSLALGSLFLWHTQRRAGDLLAAVVLLACAVLIKREGLTWAAVIAAALVFCELPTRWRIACIGIAGGALALLSLGYGITLKTPLGMLVVTLNVIELPLLGRFELGVHDILAPLILHLWISDTWGLLWWLLPALIAWQLPRIIASQAIRRCTLMVAFCLAKLIVLFVFTDAYRWVEAGTSINRLILHIAPALVIYGALLACARSPAPGSAVLPRRV